ncbi:MAG TPA: cyclase family protein [Solirubrobacterales bacterium]
MSRYDGTGSRSPQWWPSRYGADDEIGAGNELTPERTLAALQVPTEGRTIRLAQELYPGAPGVSLRKFNQIILAHETLHEMRFGPHGAETTGMEETVTSTLHIGCHLDGLGHCGINGTHYNGARYGEFYNAGGLTKFGAETFPNWVTRGVCLDICALEGVDVLPGAFEVTPEHLEAAEERQGVEVQAGDAVVIHTGWGSNYDDPDSYMGVEPGAGWDASHWLTDRRVSVVAADNWGFEVHPGDPEQPFVCHEHLLVETGTYIVENIDSSALVESGRSAFLWLMLPIPIRGATASWVSPLAVL